MLAVMRYSVLGGLALAMLATAPAGASFTQEPGSPYTVGTNPYGVSVADFNVDARPDVLVVNGTSSTVSVYLRQPNGRFAEETGSPIKVGSGPNFSAVADFNADGRPDVAVANFVSGNVTVLLRQPGGGFAEETGSPFTAFSATGVVAADFNGDSRPDLAVSNYGGSVTILLRKPGGGFAPAPAAAAGLLARNVATADFNGDGRADLAVTNLGGANVTVLLGKGDGSFEPELGAPLAVGTQPAGIIAADVNLDGRPDLAVANFGAETVSLLMRQPGGGIAPAVAVPSGARPVGLASADFDRDGRPDLVITNNNGRDSTVTILLRQPDGSYAPDPSSPVATANGAYGVAVTDFNADGKPDLAVSNDGSGNLTILLNTTPDPLPPPPPPTVVTQPPVVVQSPAVVQPVINVRLILSWSVTAKAVTLNSAILRDVPVGATVKLACKACKVKQTLTAKRSAVTLSKLRGKKLRRGAAFSVTITKPGSVGQVLTRTVKRYGRSRPAIKKAAKAPFREQRRCIPVGSAKPVARC
jgi:hypothetical protein